MLFLTEWNSHHERAAQVVKRDALLAAHKAQRGAQRAALARERDERGAEPEAAALAALR